MLLVAGIGLREFNCYACRGNVSQAARGAASIVGGYGVKWMTSGFGSTASGCAGHATGFDVNALAGRADEE